MDSQLVQNKGDPGALAMSKPLEFWVPSGYVNSLLLKMAIEVVDLPIDLPIEIVY
jgi:hypothetical protein